MTSPTPLGPDRLFAYGTLRQGFAPPKMQRIVAQLRPLGAGTARGHLFDLGPYPGAVFCDNTPDPGASMIDGIVYTVPAPSLWQDLDAYEGFDPDDDAGSLFLRRIISVEMRDHQAPILCWAYVYNGPLRPQG